MPRQAYRALLKAVDRHLTRISGNDQWREYIRLQFRQSRGLENPVEAQRQLQLARDYCFLVNNIVHHRVRGQSAPMASA